LGHRDFAGAAAGAEVARRSAGCTLSCGCRRGHLASSHLRIRPVPSVPHR
jgi:hypothetical protein